MITAEEILRGNLTDVTVISETNRNCNRKDKGVLIMMTTEELVGVMMIKDITTQDVTIIHGIAKIREKIPAQEKIQTQELKIIRDTIIQEQIQIPGLKAPREIGVVTLQIEIREANLNTKTEPIEM